MGKLGLPTEDPNLRTATSMFDPSREMLEPVSSLKCLCFELSEPSHAQTAKLHLRHNSEVGHVSKYKELSHMGFPVTFLLTCPLNQPEKATRPKKQRTSTNLAARISGAQRPPVPPLRRSGPATRFSRTSSSPRGLLPDQRACAKKNLCRRAPGSHRAPYISP